jgi:hypothetical protein
VNDTRLWGQLVAALRSLLKPHYDAGWFDRNRVFNDAVQIKVDDEVNTSATRAAGKLIAAVSYYDAETTEQVVFRLSRAGVEA